MATRIALVEDHHVLSEAMRLALTDHGFDVSVVLVGEDAIEHSSLIASVLETGPDLVLLDLDLGPAGDGSKLIPELLAGGCRVLVLTASTDFVRWGECLAMGAEAVMSKSGHLTTLVEAMLNALRGLPAMPSEDRNQLIARWQERAPVEADVRARLQQLTKREMEILRSLVAGHRVSVIAETSYVSVATVRTQVKSILSKLRVTTQIAAVALARESGISSTVTATGPVTGDLPQAR